MEKELFDYVAQRADAPAREAARDLSEKSRVVVVDTSNEIVCRYVGRILRALGERGEAAAQPVGKPVDLEMLKKPMAAINVGLESFAANLTDQSAPNIHVDWKPPAGGNERLMNILQRMKQQK